MQHFKFYQKEDVLSLTKIRRFETKLGERVRTSHSAAEFEAAIKSPEVKFVLFGIPEDLGVRGNDGVGGADSAWIPFLFSFLNTQSNDFLEGSEILIAGHFDFGDLKYLIEQNASSFDEKKDAYRHAVQTIDEEVEKLTKAITQAQKIPVAIGGGHNNAYPLIKGAAKGWHKAGVLQLAQLNVVNLDAHTDFRPAEGRHSGNPFRYAEEDGYLQKYCVVGVQENYLPQNVWTDFVNNPFLDMVTFEDIFLHEKRNFIQAVGHAISFTDDNLIGVELDLDIVENTLTSAQTPSGVSSINARQYINMVAAQAKPAYLHIAEGASQLTDGRKSETTGKLISYLVSDFIKAFAH